MANSKLPRIPGLFTHYAGTIPENESVYLNETVPVTEQLENHDISSCPRKEKRVSQGDI